MTARVMSADVNGSRDLGTRGRPRMAGRSRAGMPRSLEKWPRPRLAVLSQCSAQCGDLLGLHQFGPELPRTPGGREPGPAVRRGSGVLLTLVVTADGSVASGA